ncbi:MAG: methyltransferase domain-containing protein [Actinomycetota bacterium]
MPSDERDRPAPVSPELYTREYFTTDCEGYDLFLQGAERLPERIEVALDSAGDLRGRRILDIGCGRGELVCEAARRGAYAVGIDYAQAAIELSRERLAKLDTELRERVEFLLANATGLDFPDGSFDAVFLVDVYEHLHPHEIEHTLGEVKRVLRPGGRLVVHTGPNTWFYRFGYPLVREAARRLLRREFPESLRGQYDDIMHVNEQDPLSLYRGLTAAGFKAAVRPRSFLEGIDPESWEKAMMGVLFARPLGYLFCTSLMATAVPRESGGEARLRTVRMLRMLDTVQGDILLVGEGEGMLARRLAGRDGVRVTWLEPGSPGGVAGESPLVAEGYERLVGGPDSPPSAPGGFGAVAAQFTLDEVEDPAAALRAWHGALRDGGALVLAARNGLFGGPEQRPSSRPRRTFTPAALSALVEEAGFAVGEVSTLLPDLKLPALYRGDLGFALRLERIPYFAMKGKLLFLRAVKGPAPGRGKAP